jgi:hypothetical protein
MAWNLKLFGSASSNTVRARVEKHMGGNCLHTHIIGHPIRPVEQVGLQIVLDEWLERTGNKYGLFGYASSGYGLDQGLSQLVQPKHAFGLMDRPQSIGPVERQSIAVSGSEMLDCVVRGIYLLRFQEQPIVVMLRKGDHLLRTSPTLELMAHRRDQAQAAFSELLAEANRRSVFKGKCLSLQKERESLEAFQVRFHEWPPVARDTIVLPEAVMQVVERNVLGILQHGEKLRQSGWSNRHGVLFHGPPGTGKTLVVRYLAQASKNHTVVLLSGKQLGAIRESCEIARLLAPSIVVVEDVDLIAEDRSTNRQPVFLAELMDEMDGVGPRTDCIFLLTTNRPDVLEAALAGRPGRVDQAIEFPLPDEACRRRLFELYGQHLDMQWIDVDRWIEQTDGASPAFIAELLRKAALFAAERDEPVPMKVRNADVEQAIKELVVFGGELTRKLLGFRREE